MPFSVLSNLFSFKEDDKWICLIDHSYFDYHFPDSLSGVPIHFIQCQFEILGFKLENDLASFSIEISNDCQNWKSIYKGRNLQPQIYKINHLGSFSYLRFTNFTRHDSLSGFDVFGNLRIQNSIKISLKHNLKINSLAYYSFSLHEDSGLFSFLMSLPTKDLVEILNIYSDQTSSKSSIFNLVNDDDSIWSSNIRSDATIRIYLEQSWRFHPTGFIIKTGPGNFPKSWKLIASMCGDHSEGVTLLHFRNEKKFCSSFKKYFFSITSNRYFNCFDIVQIAANSVGNKSFCLSRIEFYGELKYDF